MPFAVAFQETGRTGDRFPEQILVRQENQAEMIRMRPVETTALHQKHIHKDYVGLDACACNLMRPAMYGAYHHITVMGKENAPADHLYDVVGGLCENNDKFAIDRWLPRVDIGDFIVIHDTGAHGHSMGYNYNGKLRSAEILLCEDGGARLIRRAETPEDYFATLDF